MFVLGPHSTSSWCRAHQASIGVGYPAAPPRHGCFWLFALLSVPSPCSFASLTVVLWHCLKSRGGLRRHGWGSLPSRRPPGRAIFGSNDCGGRFPRGRFRGAGVTTSRSVMVGSASFCRVGSCSRTKSIFVRLFLLSGCAVAAQPQVFSYPLLDLRSCYA